ncbi:MAG: hypothetical protein QG604_506 [Candidatus Dependentiae bacterium]|nr:hypothetical protein [Candidatus Dependentiae bacterium]
MNFRSAVGVLVFLWWVPLVSSVSVSVDGVSFDRYAGTGDGELFVAQSTIPDDNLQYSVARMSLTRTNEGAYQASMVGLVPQQVRINNAMAANKNNPREMLVVVSDNPLYEQCVKYLSTYKGYPLVGFAPAASPVHSVALITELDSGLSMLVNRLPFGDALGAVTSNIVGLTGAVYTRRSMNPAVPTTSFGFIFAAVTPSDSSSFLGQAAAGIGIAQVLGDGIVPFDALGRNSGPQAAPLTSDLIAIGDIGTIAEVRALCWNEALNKLFVALRTNDGGVAVAVGSVDISSDAKANGKLISGAQFKICPSIVGATGVNLETDWDDNDYIIASTADGLSPQLLDVMNASTGNNYLIVSRDDVNVYSLPLTPAGLLATKNDSTAAATLGSADQLYTTDDTPAIVGCGEAPAAINSLRVYGDSVFASCLGDSDTTNGVFVSQALFDITGAIRGWSPWKPVVVASNPISGFARDKLNRMKFLAGDSDTIYAQVWGQCRQNGYWGGTSTDESVGLVRNVNQFFTAENGGVQNVISVQSLNGGWYNTSSQVAAGSSMLFFTGRNRCAFALTAVGGARIIGADSSSVSNLWTYDFTAAGTSLGMITTAAISASDAVLIPSGWFFVGGSDGVAVLCQSDGSAWDGTDESELATDFAFNVLKKSDGTDFSQVSQILTDRTGFYIVCADGMYRCSYNADNFANGIADETLIASPTVLFGVSYETILSAVIVGNYAFLATSKGLWVNDGALADVTDTLGSGGWNEIPMVPGSSESFGVCSQLLFVPGNTIDDGGMLYILTADVALNVASIYRVDIPSGSTLTGSDRDEMGAVIHTIDTVARTYMSILGQFREYFYTDGGISLDASSQHHTFLAEGRGMLRVLPMSAYVGQIDAWVDSVQPIFDVGTYTSTISGVVRELATGTIIISGAWGIQILQ